MRQSPECFGLARSRWRLCDLRQVCEPLGGYTLSGICLLLKRLEVRLKRGRLSVHSPDPQYAPKLELIGRARELARSRPQEAVFLYCDEFSLQRQPTLAAAYAPSGEVPVARLSLRPNTRARYVGSLDAQDGQVVWQRRGKMGVAGLCEFLTQVAEHYQGRRVYLAWDNWPVHRHPRVLERARELGIELLWLPTYAPWTNPIEKLWRYLKQQLLHHHRLSDQWDLLNARAGSLLDQFRLGSLELLHYVGLLPS